MLIFQSLIGLIKIKGDFSLSQQKSIDMTGCLLVLNQFCHVL